MIDEIQVKNLALIANATLEPCPGLTVLTGETGAGKTALLTALKLLMGERGDKSFVRDGQRELYVAGRFVADGDEVVAVRRVTEDGRSRVTLDGEMAGTGELAARIAPLVDLCSQHENQQLTRPANHLALLDSWAGKAAAEALSDYENAWSAAKSARAALEAVQEASRATGARLDQARYTLRRIDALSPKEGEYEELLAELRRAENAEALATAADGAYRALSGGDFGGGAADLIAEAAQALEAAARHDEALRATASTLRDAEAAVQDAAMWARAYRDDLDFDAEGLSAKQERVAAMQGLMRAFGPRMEDVFAARAAAADLVSMVDDAELRLAEATRALDAAEDRLARAREALHAVRAEAAPRFPHPAPSVKSERGGVQRHQRVGAGFDTGFPQCRFG
ncbi:MAG: AAA family ATPase, partial [Eggerthellaceae bacterium]|nr:AAA family ATPase [Eggerthellaceae bacterium]